MQTPAEYQFYSDLVKYGFNLDSPPALTSTTTDEISAPTNVTRFTHAKAVSKSDASISIGISISIALTGCVALAAWLCYRKYKVSAPKSSTSSEQ